MKYDTSIFLTIVLLMLYPYFEKSCENVSLAKT